MGETGAPEFEESLEKLPGDGDSRVRAMAEKSRAKLRMNPVTSPGSGPASRLAWLSDYKSRR